MTATLNCCVEEVLVIVIVHWGSYANFNSMYKGDNEIVCQWNNPNCNLFIYVNHKSEQYAPEKGTLLLLAFL